jgi:hypothetical protein
MRTSLVGAGLSTGRGLLGVAGSHRTLARAGLLRTDRVGAAVVLAIGAGLLGGGLLLGAEEWWLPGGGGAPRGTGHAGVGGAYPPCSPRPWLSGMGSSTSPLPRRG